MAGKPCRCCNVPCAFCDSNGTAQRYKITLVGSSVPVAPGCTSACSNLIGVHYIDSIGCVGLISVSSTGCAAAVTSFRLEWIFTQISGTYYCRINVRYNIGGTNVIDNSWQVSLGTGPAPSCSTYTNTSIAYYPTISEQDVCDLSGVVVEIEPA